MTIIRTTRTNYAIGLVLYHPEESLLKRINQMTELGYRVYVFDNSPLGATYSKVVQGNSEISYITAGKNVGIAYSLSTLCATAYAHGFTRLLFLDQDTGISAQTLEFIEQFPQSLPADIQPQYAALVFSGQTSDGHVVKDVRLAISSGSLFNLTVLKQIGWHNENYFVDCVDYELCLRARRYGFKIGIVDNTPDFDHVTEQPDQAFDFFGKKLLVRRYSVSRIKDALGAYLKLIFGGLFRNSLSDTIVLSRSLGLYIFGQLIARLIQGK
jgi:GT2 family glycosyltransferase